MSEHHLHEEIRCTRIMIKDHKEYMQTYDYFITDEKEKKQVSQTLLSLIKRLIDYEKLLEEKTRGAGLQ